MSACCAAEQPQPVAPTSCAFLTFLTFLLTPQYYLQYKNVRPDYLNEIWKVRLKRRLQSRHAEAAFVAQRSRPADAAPDPLPAHAPQGSTRRLRLPALTPAPRPCSGRWSTGRMWGGATTQPPASERLAACLLGAEQAAPRDPAGRLCWLLHSVQPAASPALHTDMPCVLLILHGRTFEQVARGEAKRGCGAG